MVMNNSTYNQLNANLETLKLTQMQIHLDEIRDFVTNNGLLWSSIFVTLLTVKIMFFYFCSYRASKGVL